MMYNNLFSIVRGIDNDVALIRNAVDDMTLRCNRNNTSAKKVKLEMTNKALNFTLVQDTFEVKGVILIKDIYEKVKSKELSPLEIEQMICDMIESKAVEEFFLLT